jgi:hypothetical protein
MKAVLISFFPFLRGLTINNKGQNCFCHTVDSNAKTESSQLIKDKIEEHLKIQSI